MHYSLVTLNKGLRMADVTLELIGEQLRRLVESQRTMEELLADIRHRLQSVETNGIEVRREVVNMHADIIRIDHRLDRLDDRIAHIERRLDLVDS